MASRNPDDKIMEEKLTPELLDTMYDALIGGRVRRGGVDFDPNADTWEMDYRRRRGKPLYMLKEAWYSLRSYSPDELPTVSSSSLLFLPNKPVSGELPLDLLRSLENLSIQKGQGSFSRCRKTTDYTMSTRRKVLPLIDAYRRSLPGLADDRSEALLRAMIQKVEDSPDGSVSRIRRVTSNIEYRLRLMELADRYVTCLDLQEKGRSCSGFDMENWKRKQPPERVDRLQEIVKILGTKFVFPATILEKQGKVFPKPWEYLAMVMMERGGTPEEFEKDLAVILNCE
jgi:hypothetical protein